MQWDPVEEERLRWQRAGIGSPSRYDDHDTNDNKWVDDNDYDDDDDKTVAKENVPISLMTVVTLRVVLHDVVDDDEDDEYDKYKGDAYYRIRWLLYHV